MTARSPEGAPPRADLPWLRHRRAQQAHIEYVHPPRHRDPPAARPPAPSLDLSAPTTAPATAPAPAPSPDQTPASVPSAAPQQPPRQRPRTLPHPRVPAGATTVLTAARPTVTLTRLQSGTGRLRVSLARGDAAGDLAMGMVCQTADGAVCVVQRDGDVLTTPVSAGTSSLPLVRLAVEDGLDTFSVDLRQVRRLRRALFYGHSPGVQVLRWDGVVVVTASDGSRVEAPFDLPPLSGTVALLTVYAVQGELVLRAELEPFAGPPETAAQAYGYAYGWLGGRLPVR